jgi:large subunit ribosomal protein L23
VKDPYGVIIRPLLSEKSVDGSAKGKYSFRVRRDATKIEIRRAVETLFPNTKVGQVNTMVVRAKRRRLAGFRRAGRYGGTTASWKKAIVTLKSGTIPVFEGM